MSTSPSRNEPESKRQSENTSSKSSDSCRGPAPENSHQVKQNNKAGGEASGTASSSQEKGTGGEASGGVRAGLRDGVSIFLGYLPIALAFGILAKNTGISLNLTVGMSLLVFAGASQFMALELIALSTGAFEIIFSTFIVNIRHLLMSMSIQEKAVDEDKKIKALYAFFITDEVFAVAGTREETVSSPYIFGIGIMAYLGWTVNTAVGYLAGAILPLTLQAGMTIALYALFIGLLVPSIKKQRKALYLAGSAAVLNYLFLLFLPTGWAIITASAVAVAGVELLSPGGEAENSGEKESGGQTLGRESSAGKRPQAEVNTENTHRANTPKEER